MTQAPEKKEEAVPVPASKDEPSPLRHKCRFVTAIVAGSLLFIKQAVCIGLSVTYNAWVIFTLAIVLMLITIFAGINLFGNYNLWKKLKDANKIILIIITFVLVIAVCSSASSIVTLNSQRTLTSAEVTNRDSIITVLILVVIVSVIDYALFLMLYVPMFYLYPEDDSKDKTKYTQLSQNKA